VPRDDVVLTVRSHDPADDGGSAGGSGGGSGTTVDLRAGDTLRFGSCPCRDCAHRLLVPVPGSVRVAGLVTAHRDHWRLDNLSPACALVCRDLEDPTQRVDVAPGRLAAPVPFELARISVPSQCLTWSITVFGPEPAALRELPACSRVASAAPTLDPRTTHYAVLHVLARPRLCGDVAARLPSSTEIARELAECGVAVTRRAVDHHIDYLADRFGITSQPAGRPAHGVRAVRREALVQAAVASGALTLAPGQPLEPPALRLLPSPTDGRRPDQGARTSGAADSSSVVQGSPDARRTATSELRHSTKAHRRRPKNEAG
jgi:hypothetical protein